MTDRSRASLLDLIERLGNKLPEPPILFCWLALFVARGQLALRYWRRMITPGIILPEIVSLICLALLPDSNPLAEMKNAASK